MRKQPVTMKSPPGNGLGPQHFRFYSCKESDRTNRRIVVFIHVFKTAGSSIRRILADMAGRKCGFGYATIVRDKIKDSRDRRGKTIKRLPSPLNDPETLDYVRQHVDILAGHQLYDTANLIWPELPEHAFGKFSYIRTPLHRYVSGIIYQDKKQYALIKSLDDAIDIIRKDVDDCDALGLRYWEDLSTTAEREDPALLNDMENQVEIIKSRLDSLVMVGVVERWDQSLHLLGSMMYPEGRGRKLRSKHKNKSQMPASVVVSAIKRDKPLYRDLLHVLRYEQQIYDHGFGIHMKQCTRMNIS